MRRIFVLAGCAVVIASGLYAARASADKTIVIPNGFRAYQLDAVGSLELQPDWTEAARRNLHEALTRVVDTDTQLEITPYPTLTDDEQLLVDEHVALFEANAMAAMQMIAQARIDEKQARPEYSIGPGLAFLAERGLADRAIVITGSQSWSTGGRVFMMVLAAAAGAYVSGGQSGLLVGHVDLRSGDVLWMNYMTPMTGGDVREAAQTEPMLRKVTDAYPDGRLYRAKD